MSAATAARKSDEDRSLERIDAKHDPLGYLSHQHREVEALFHDLDALSAKDMAEREHIFTRLATCLRLHTQLEEEIFYPAVQNAAEELILKAHEEHALAKDLITKIQRSGPEDPTFKAKANVLREIVHHHVMEEEQEIFPKVMETIGEEDLRQLYDAIRAREEALTRENAKTQGGP